MITDANEIETATSIECDLCIIGAGAAGITIARELDGTGLNVWLLESGGFDFEQDTQDLYKGTSTGHSYFRKIGINREDINNIADKIALIEITARQG